MTGVGLTVLLACVVQFARGDTNGGRYGLVLGLAIVVFNEWRLWKRRTGD